MRWEGHINTSHPKKKRKNWALHLGQIEGKIGRQGGEEAEIRNDAIFGVLLWIQRAGFASEGLCALLAEEVNGWKVSA